MVDISLKIRELIDYKKLNYSKLGKEIGVSGVAISDIAKGKSKPNFVFISTVLQKFPEISAEWLLRDEGSMLKNEYNTNRAGLSVSEPEAFYANNNAKQKLIDCQEKIINLQEQVNALQKQLFETKLQQKNILKTDK